MTDIIKTVLSLLFDKARDVASSELSEGDLTDEKFRKVIAREINEINKKLDALGRKDLLSSVQFLKEGLNRLLMAMEEKSINSDVPTTSRNTELVTLMAVNGASTSRRRVIQAFTISNAFTKKFEVVSPKRLKKANKSFENSGKEATQAFANEALSIDDRIMATKLRIVSRILESFLDDPEAGGSDCLVYLEELHNLSAVREMYSVHVGGGPKSYFKSFFNREDREQKVQTIESMNTAVRDFIAAFTTKRFYDGVNWPAIQLRNKDQTFTFHTKRNIELSRIKARWPEIDCPQEMISIFWYYAVTKVEQETATEFIASQAKPLKTDSRVCRDIHDFRVQDRNVLCLTMDASFSIYVLTYVCESPNSALVFTIFAFDSDEKLSKRIKTDLSCGSNSSRIVVFVMQVLQGKIAVLRDQLDCRRVSLIDFSTGETYHTISLPPQPEALYNGFKPCINILNDSEVMVTRSDDKAVDIYTNEEQLKQTIYLPSEKAFRVWDIAYRPASEEILVLTIFFQNSASSEEKELPNYRLLVYSTEGALQDSYGLHSYSPLDSLFFVNDSGGKVKLFDLWSDQILRL